MSDRPEQIKGDILVVDDTPDNLRLLASMLTEQGYKVRKAINGQLALMAAQSAPPDLILLDINMPDMDGYEVCERLKRDILTLDIPVIFISALDDVLDKVKAFNVGGVDYVTKPFQLQEVLARMDNQLTVRRLQRHLQEQNLQLKQLLRDRIRAQESLRQAEEKYRALFENAGEGIFQTSPEGEYLSVNQALADIYGYDSPDEMIDDFNSNEIKPYVSMSLRKEFENRLEELGTVSGFESQIYRRDGTMAWIRESLNAVRDGQEELLFYVGTVEDISDRRELELAESSRQNMDQLQMIAQAIPLPVMISRTSDGEILYANPIASSTFGIASWDLIGRKIQSLYNIPQDTKNISDILHKEGYVRNYELICKPEGRNIFRALLSLQPFTFAHESALIGIFFHISDR
jgi:PAS domain S-box-containing protein